MIIYFITGKPRPEIHTPPSDQFSEPGGDDLTLLVVCVLQKPAPFWIDPIGASNHITAFIKSKYRQGKGTVTEALVFPKRV
jgi:hypothetical protein